MSFLVFCLVCSALDPHFCQETDGDTAKINKADQEETVESPVDIKEKRNEEKSVRCKPNKGSGHSCPGLPGCSINPKSSVQDVSNLCYEDSSNNYILMGVLVFLGLALVLVVCCVWNASRRQY